MIDMWKLEREVKKQAFHAFLEAMGMRQLSYYNAQSIKRIADRGL